MEFRILGPLEVESEGLEVPLGGPRQRALLAFLLLHSNESVSADRLIDALWRGSPPASAAKVVQNNIARLRKAIGDRIVTRPPGYLLRVEPGELDASRFETLVDEARRADPEGRAKVLREALGLWRGPALADLAYEDFAQAEISRLEELRLAALEDRIDADLELGRHGALVGELEGLVATYPLRERLRALLMLALYRSGRQTEALDVYSNTRRLLVDELGLEPSEQLRDLQRQILAHDPALGPPDRVDETATPSPRISRRRWIVAGAVVVVAASAAVGAVLASRASPSVRVSANSVAVIDPGNDRVAGDIAVGARPAAIAAGQGAVWVANLDDATVSRIDPKRGAVVRTISVGEPATGLAVGAGSVWVSAASGAVRRIDPGFDAVVQTIKAKSYARYGFEIDPTLNKASPVAVGSGRVWFGHSTTVSEIDPRAGQNVGSIGVDFAPSAITVADRAVWVADTVDDNVIRIDPGGTTTTIPVGHGPDAITFGDRALWVADSRDDAIVRVDPSTSAVDSTIRVGSFPTGVAFGGGSVWVANSRDGTVSRIDPRTNRVVRTINLGGEPERIAVADGRVWVSVKASTAGPTPVVASGGRATLDAPGDFDSIDPAVAGDAATLQLEYATCAKLLTYPDRPAPFGWKLVPEVAAALPSVTDRGRTYTFTVRRGFRFSPPANEPVTAETFRHVIERDLSPRLHSEAANFLGDIVGAKAFEAGRASNIAGVSAHGDRLTIRLLAPAPDFPARIASPYLCAVPTNTPLEPQRQPIPSAGPYYIASYSAGERLVLLRNPKYRGSRPRRLAELDYTFGVEPSRAVAAIEAGNADYAVSSFIAGALPWQQIPALNARYGPASPAAKSGHQQFFENPLDGNQWIALNANRPLFRSASLRRAVAFALDRPALARDHQYSFHPDDHFLMPGMPGYLPVEPYPVRGPDLETAQRLAGRRHAVAIDYSCNGCSDDVLARELARIGIDVAVRQLPVAEMLRRIKTPGEPVDIFGGGGQGFRYADPVELLNHLFIGRTVGAFAPHDPVLLRRLTAADRLSGAARSRAFGRLDVALVRDAFLIPLGWSTSDDLFSVRIGCQVFQPVYGMDLGALCVRK